MSSHEDHAEENKPATVRRELSSRETDYSAETSSLSLSMKCNSRATSARTATHMRSDSHCSSRPDSPAPINHYPSSRSMLVRSRGKSFTGKTESKPIRSRKTTSSRICGRCGLPVSGQYVRALNDIFHLDCFRCYDCGVPVATKFFPTESADHTGQIPLCEKDYFRRLDLLCANCGMALRGYYITALNKKYHIEHFTCTLCSTIFGPNDSYYEHDGNVYCHYHYSTMFASRCCGCRGPILRQFVEVFRNGTVQSWHVPCHMIFKFWNVKLPTATDEVLGKQDVSDGALVDQDEQDSVLYKKHEKQMEQRIFHIWRTLSAYEEYTASCISDMLLHVSNRDFMKCVLVVQKFIMHVEVLFKGIDSLEHNLFKHQAKGMPYIREAKLLCKKLVSIFALIAKCHKTELREVSAVQEFLSLFSGLAHYLKLLIRISLTGGLRLEQDHKFKAALPQFLLIIENSRLLDESYSTKRFQIPPSYADAQSDLCYICHQALEEDCVYCSDIRCHIQCLSCASCKYTKPGSFDWARWNDRKKEIQCYLCFTDPDLQSSDCHFRYASRLTQYTYLLRIALARLYRILADNTLAPIKPTSQLKQVNFSSSTVVSSSDSRSTQNDESSVDTFKKYASTLNDLRRLKSSRNISRSQSVLVPDISTPVTRMKGHHPTKSTSLIITPDIQQRPKASNSHELPKTIEEKEPPLELYDDCRAFTLDDIPKVIAEQRNREHRPNAFRHMPSFAASSIRKASENIVRTGDQQCLSLPATPPQRRFTELTNLQLLFTKHVAVLTLHPLVKDYYSLDELMEMSDLRKGRFWEKFGKAFKSRDSDRKNMRKKGVFGVPLDVLVERNGVKSSLAHEGGVSRVPQFIEDTLKIMKQKDMSVVGVFRKNGNIRRLKELSDQVDNTPESVHFENEGSIQLAALLKKFLRELPDPLLTFKLFGLFITSSKLEEEEDRLRVLHLTICLLPKSHRDTMEIIFGFLYWVASFSHINDDLGSKMDIHNLATVITPNILYSKSNDPVDESFLAIEAVHSLIEHNERFCLVPTEINILLDDPALFSSTADWSSKELAKRCEDLLEQIRLDESSRPKRVASTKRKRQPLRKVATSMKTNVATASEMAPAASYSESNVPGEPVIADHIQTVSAKAVFDTS
ncbi:rho-type GTPase activating protein Rga1 [Schizosaccharomyces japonicus yFS275]|uniref:Rho-type GTPase activating protein Rga1 n=1 Tax=Schizosaccharomyces japonicus (strain yFS275 / FY16936) TaxID=402676 RepID=B6K4U2_SCHJY|nr:rho-type GTPase activating protein Rga1 [Schizosaccharomyces japonicus yFS275]EEB08499.1 rho-type GTPase activating protein Rga1 [Schizosaccharomyces japonicus yFS275]